MGDRWVLFFYVIITSYIQVNHGCSIDGIPNWLLPQSIRILDTDSGIVYRRSTTGIEDINSVTHRKEGLNGGPYVTVSLVNSELTISTHVNYKTYEDIETAQSIGFTANFRCADGSSRNLVFSIDITDTNNNDPVFKPSNSYELTLAPPVPPNFLLTNCINDIIVRDIDLTTERIDFVLEGSQLFEIAYDNSSTVPKEFKATLRTTTFIRSIPEAIILTIIATDVDRTGDPRRTATATVKVLADSQFELPDEPIFSQPFYIANYTKEHEFILQDSIYLRQGYDSEVKFSLDGQFSENFELVNSGNEISFTVTTPLPEESFQRREIYLTVIAEREYTSGANAMIVLLLPEARELSFEKPLYIGTLEGYTVAHETIILSNGDYSDVTFNLIGQYEEHFVVKTTQNTVLIELQKEVSENIIKENNFIALNLVAFGINAITTSTTIFLEILKPDYETPIFSQKIYNGLYSNDSKVNFQDINLFQGYDETVMFDLVGDHAKYFSMETTTNNIVLALNSTIPEDLIFNEKVLLFNIVAEKPRTVGANTAVALKFPVELTEPTILKFTKSTYNGVLKDDKLTVEDIILESGFTSQTKFTLNGDFNQDFTISNTNNVVTIAISNSESLEEIEKNKFVLLEIEATGERAVAVTTSVIIDIPEIVIVYPIFEKSFYRGSYTKDGGLVFTEEISLRQGYDSSVKFSLEGESSQWFSLIQNEDLVKLIPNETNPLPVDIIDKNSHLLFTVAADKLGAIGGRAAIHIDLPKETEDPIVLQFEKLKYIGRMENESLQLDEIRLLNVHVSSVALNLTGEFASYFIIKEQSDFVTIEPLDIPKELLENNNFIVLNLEASLTNAIKGHTTIILDIVKSQESQILSPIFEQTYYTGEYSNQEGLIFSDEIKLRQGFDETVSFELEGDSSQWFNLVQKEENSFTLSVKNDNLNEVTNQFPLIFTIVAHKTTSKSARATIIITLKGSEAQATFSKILYNGKLEDGVVSHDPITISGYDGTDIQIIGDYESSFEVTFSSGVVTIRKAPSAVFPVELTHIALTLQAGHASAVLLIDVMDSGSETEATFSKVLYNGKLENGVVSHETITITGYEGTSVQIIGIYESSFEVELTNGIVTISRATAAVFPVGLTHIALTLQAGRASSVLLLDVADSGSEIEATFSKVLYSGKLENGVVSHETITLFGYDGTNVQIIGEHESLFEVNLLNGVVTISKAASAVVPVGLRHIALTLQAGRANAVLLLDITDTESEIEATFSKVLYNGKIENGVVSHETITITGYEGTSLQIIGTYESSFEVELTNGIVTISRATAAVFPVGLTHIALTLQAGRASSVLLLDVADSGSEIEATFSKVLYSGKLENGVVSHETITLFGYDGTNVQIIGEHESLFEVNLLNGVVTISKAASAVVPVGLRHIALTLQAGRANAVLLLDITDTESEIEATFSKVLYNGKIENGVVSHETITITGYEGTSLQIIGTYESSFEVELTNGIVTISRATAAVFPVGLTHIALTLQAGRASSVLLLDVADSGSEIEATFSKVLYSGKLENGVVSHETITLFGYDGTNVQIIGEHESLFEVNLLNGVVTISKAASAVVPVGLRHIALTLQAGRANAVLLLDITDTESEIEATFSKVLYNGKIENGVVSHETITITGYEGTSLQIIGTYESSFEVELTNGIVTISRATAAVFPVGLTHIALTLQAGRASSVLLLDVADSGSEIEATFSKVLYSGKLENGVVSHETITLFGYDGTNVQIIGEHESLFEVNLLNGVVTISKAASAVVPVGLRHIALTLQAGRANAVLLLDITDTESEIEATFSKVLYNGKIENGVVSHETITITGYEGTSLQIIGTYESSFEVELTNGIVTISRATAAVFPVGLTHIALTLQAGRASSVLLLDVADSGSEIEATFSKVLYSGKLENGVVSHETITLFGYDGTNVQIIGEHESLFEVNLLNGVVTISKAASAVVPVGLRHIALTLQAGRANAVLLLDITDTESEIEATFSKVLYNGNIENGVLSHETITISGYDGTSIQIIGAYESLFDVNVSNGIVTLSKAASAVLPVGLTHIALTLRVGRASAVLLLDVTNNGSEIGATFSKVLYNGNLENGVLSHETITVFGYDGTSVQIVGAYESSFEVNFSNAIVTIRKATSAVFPVGLTHIALTLQAGRASAVLLIDVTDSGDTNQPTVTFSRTSYFLWADINQSGVIGKVQATAENGERILYSLQIDDDDNLRERISINNAGEILLSDVVQSGVYSFIVTATAENSRVNATASVLLRVEALPECSSDIGLPPLIVLEKPEEEPHKNLVVLNHTKYKDCRYNLLNSWPTDQSWLYVDEEGLHAKAIDREHESIAFMTLSQIQVELILQCDSDEVSVAKRSLNTDRLQVGPYEYGSNKWILADTIVYDARRSFVNLIVNDINDNKPIFIGTENETIYVGFPVPELEDIILPRALIELKATDADIGENAALIYWSTEDNLAVAPKTGFVHVRNNARLENNSRLTVYATDLNGEGLTGTLNIVVKLLNKYQIAVITVRNAFLDDENSVLNGLSEAVGYEIKVLRTVVISENNEDSSRKRRDVESSGASLQLYVYGLRESQPVDVLSLTSDINNSNVVSVNVARVLSLEDHLEGLEICTIPGRDTALFVATIVLAVLLLIVIVVIFVWFILIKKFQIHLKWRKNENYDQFDDSNSLESRNSAMEPIPKVEIQSKPRLNIEELKRSERRLQEMLDIPVQEIRPVEPGNAVKDITNEIQVETILDIPNPISPLPIVIQSIDKLKTDDDGSDDDDEFGEEKKEKPRKSVVTFNENVEKIIHLEDNYEDSSEPDLEVYKF